MNMENKQDYFLSEIADVPTGVVIIYYIQVYLETGEIIVENNEGKYFFYKVGAPIEFSEEPNKSIMPDTLVYDNLTPTVTSNNKAEYQEAKDNVPLNMQYYKHNKETISSDSKSQSTPSRIQPPKVPEEYHFDKNRTIFGLPQMEIDPDLKVCPYCNSKIKKMWSICPICGKNL
jgi:hypothetical protein